MARVTRPHTDTVQNLRPTGALAWDVQQASRGAPPPPRTRRRQPAHARVARAAVTLHCVSRVYARPPAAMPPSVRGRSRKGLVPA
jgi:hypothetical protein